MTDDRRNGHGHTVVNEYRRILVMLWATGFVQVRRELVELLLLRPDIDFHLVVREVVQLPSRIST